MFVLVKRKIGKETVAFGIEGESLHEAVKNSKNLSFYDVHQCGICGSDNLELGAHVAQEKFPYTYIRCRDCGGVVNFGQKMENPDVVYLRTREDENGNKVLDWKQPPKKEENNN